MPTTKLRKKATGLDAFDEAAAYLRARPGEILAAWQAPDSNPGGVLFAFLSRDGYLATWDRDCGCPTMVHAGDEEAETDQLTALVRRQDGLPDRPEQIGVEHLHLFARVQRAAGRLLRRGAEFFATHRHSIAATRAALGA